MPNDQPLINAANRSERLRKRAQPLSPANRELLADVLAAYPPGPMSDARAELSDRLGVSTKTIWKAVNGLNLSTRSRRLITSQLPELAEEYRGVLEKRRGRIIEEPPIYPYLRAMGATSDNIDAIARAVEPVTQSIISALS